MTDREIKIDDRILIRLHKDGTLDEIILFNEKGTSIFHMEQMDNHLYWMRAYGKEKDLVVWMGVTEGKDKRTGKVRPIIEAKYEEEEK